MSGVLSYAGKNIKWNCANDAQPLVNDIKNASDLRCLQLEGNTLGVEAAKVIGDALAEHPEFERAHWKDLFTGRMKEEIPEALKHLFSGIERSKAKLVELDLSDNALGYYGVLGIVRFIQTPSCYSLEELLLNNNGLGIKGGTLLAEALLKLADNAKNAGSPLKLKVFIAGRNRLEDPGAQIFSQIFSKVKTLEEVCMPQNGITHVGIAAIAEALSQNLNLQRLNLNDNLFTPKGAIEMAKHLPEMENLEVINFGDCLLKNDGAIAIAKSLKNGHHKLKEVLLDSNCIAISGGLAVVDALSNKTALYHLLLDANDFGDDVNLIQEAMRKAGKEEALGSLEENTEPDSEVEEEDEKEDDVEEENEEELYDEQKEEIECTFAEFSKQPSSALLMGLSKRGVSFVEEAQKMASDLLRDRDLGEPGSAEAMIHEYFRVFMWVSSTIPPKEKPSSSVLETCRHLLQAALKLEEEHGLTGSAVNTLLVHLGFIKSESKKFQPNPSFKGAVRCVDSLLPEDFIPLNFRKTLRSFLTAPVQKKVDQDDIETLISNLVKHEI